MCYKNCHIPEKILSWLNIEEEEKKQGKFLCPMCYKNCHIHEKFLSWLNIEEEEKTREVFVPYLLQKLSAVIHSIPFWLVWAEQGINSIDYSNLSFCFTLDLFVLLCHNSPKNELKLKWFWFFRSLLDFSRLSHL